jgi:AcrR family transcriptional regulator
MSKRATTETSAVPTGNATRRDHIVQLAAQLFAERGVANTTVRDIGNAAGILSGSLYYHFDSKESIVKEIVLGYLRRLIESYETVLDAHEEPRARLEGLIRASFEAIDRDQHACEIFQNDFKHLHTLQDFADLDALTSRVQTIWVETIKSGVANGTFRDDVDPRVFYRFARDSIWFAVRWYRPGGPHNVDKLSDAASSILLDGFAADGSSAGRNGGPARVRRPRRTA